MELTSRHNTPIIVSDKLVDFLGLFIGFTGKNGKPKAMGFTIFPCIIVFRNLTHPMTEQWINHERIHIRQFFESFYLAYFYSQLEYFYARIFLKLSHIEAYRYEAIEQEAYLNQSNTDYLKKRPVFNIWKYIRTKQKFDIDEQSRLIRR